MKKITLIVAVLLIFLMIIPATASQYSPDLIPIINIDKTNLRNEKGTPFARIGCYAPITVCYSKGDMTYIMYPKALTSLYTSEYTLEEYKDAYTTAVL